MAKNKIPKNRSLEDMFAGVKEELTFETTCRKKWGPFYWILNWPIIRTASVIYRCKWLKTAGISLLRRLRKPENTIHKVVLQ